jgi:hypothetical protein
VNCDADTEFKSLTKDVRGCEPWMEGVRIFEKAEWEAAGKDPVVKRCSLTL